MAVEGAPAGVEAAHAAGLMVIAIRTRPDVSLDADEVADSLSDPRFPAWLRLTRAPR
jgi:beta-phosphoglucomutase-like phosphatase (HAD superfamily)